MATFSFKSSGKTQEQRVVEALQRSSKPIGIKTPLRPGTTEGVFAMHYSINDTVHDNLRNLLLTNHGERLGLYDFGANLRPLVTEFVSQDDFDSAAVDRIRTAVARWMPFIELEDYVSDVVMNSNNVTATVSLTITYNVSTLSVKKKPIKIELYVI